MKKLLLFVLFVQSGICADNNTYLQILFGSLSEFTQELKNVVSKINASVPVRKKYKTPPVTTAPKQPEPITMADKLAQELGGIIKSDTGTSSEEDNDDWAELVETPEQTISRMRKKIADTVLAKYKSGYQYPSYMSYMEEYKQTFELAFQTPSNSNPVDDKKKKNIDEVTEDFAKALFSAARLSQEERTAYIKRINEVRAFFLLPSLKSLVPTERPTSEPVVTTPASVSTVPKPPKIVPPTKPQTESTGNLLSDIKKGVGLRKSDVERNLPIVNFRTSAKKIAEQLNALKTAEQFHKLSVENLIKIATDEEILENINEETREELKNIARKKAKEATKSAEIAILDRSTFEA